MKQIDQFQTSFCSLIFKNTLNQVKASGLQLKFPNIYIYVYIDREIDRQRDRQIERQIYDIHTYIYFDSSQLEIQYNQTAQNFRY